MAIHSRVFIRSNVENGLPAVYAWFAPFQTETATKKGTTRDASGKKALNENISNIYRERARIAVRSRPVFV